ncbi:MAG TPA: hypothetical protein VFB32_09805 [Rudaea sp.]|nr:hypothetical protein [Rudaea sp.]
MVFLRWQVTDGTGLHDGRGYPRAPRRCPPPTPGIHCVRREANIGDQREAILRALDFLFNGI